MGTHRMHAHCTSLRSMSGLQDLSRADIHRIGPPHEKEFGGLFWAHLLHHHVGSSLQSSGSSVLDMEGSFSDGSQTFEGLLVAARPSHANGSS